LPQSCPPTGLLDPLAPPSHSLSLPLHRRLPLDRPHCPTARRLIPLTVVPVAPKLASHWPSKFSLYSLHHRSPLDRPHWTASIATAPLLDHPSSPLPCPLCSLPRRPTLTLCRSHCPHRPYSLVVIPSPLPTALAPPPHSRSSPLPFTSIPTCAHSPAMRALSGHARTLRPCAHSPSFTPIVSPPTTVLPGCPATPY
jgi:hypothetical protein